MDKLGAENIKIVVARGGGLTLINLSILLGFDVFRVQSYRFGK